MAKVVKKEKPTLIISKAGGFLFAAGLALIVYSFIIMWEPPVDGFMTRTLAPVLLTAAFLVIIPLAILIKPKQDTEEAGKNT